MILIIVNFRNNFIFDLLDILEVRVCKGSSSCNSLSWIVN